MLDNLIQVLYEQAEVEIKNLDYYEAQTSLAQVLNSIKNQPEHHLFGKAKKLSAELNRYMGKFQSALNAAEEALEFFIRRQDYQEIFCIRELMGDIYYQFCKLKEALQQWNLALEVTYINFKKENFSDFKARIYMKLGELLFNISQTKQARSNYIKGLTYSWSEKDLLLMGRFHAGIGATFHQENQFNLALHIYYRALKYARKNQDKFLIGRLLHNFGDIFTKTGKIRRAKINYEKSLEITEGNGDFLISAASLRELGRLYLKVNLEKTLSFVERSCDILIENISAETRCQCERMLGKNFYTMALYYFKLHEREMAMKYLVEAGEIFHKFDMKKEKKRSEILYRQISGFDVKAKPFPKPQPLMVKLGIG